MDKRAKLDDGWLSVLLAEEANQTLDRISYHRSRRSYLPGQGSDTLDDIYIPQFLNENARLDERQLDILLQNQRDLQNDYADIARMRAENARLRQILEDQKPLMGLLVPCNQQPSAVAPKACALARRPEVSGISINGVMH